MTIVDNRGDFWRVFGIKFGRNFTVNLQGNSHRKAYNNKGF